jgi:hypothetical protein
VITPPKSRARSGCLLTGPRPPHPLRLLNTGTNQLTGARKCIYAHLCYLWARFCNGERTEGFGWPGTVIVCINALSLAHGPPIGMPRPAARGGALVCVFYFTRGRAGCSSGTSVIKKKPNLASFFRSNPPKTAPNRAHRRIKRRRITKPSALSGTLPPPRP